MVKAQDFDSCIDSSNLSIPAISKRNKMEGTIYQKELNLALKHLIEQLRDLGIQG